MNKTEILVVGNTREIVEKVISILNESGEWNGIAAFTDEEAISKFQQYNIDIVMLARDVTHSQERKLSSLFSFQNPAINVTRFEGDDAITLKGMIQTILENGRGEKPSFVVIDDALKNAGLNIRLQ